MKKLITFVLCCMLLSTASVSFASGAEGMIKAGAELVSAFRGDGQSDKVEVTNSNLTNKVTIQEGASIGNSGIEAKGKNVTISNSKIDNKVTIKRGVSVGNSGIKLGAE